MTDTKWISLLLERIESGWHPTPADVDSSVPQYVIGKWLFFTAWEKGRGCTVDILLVPDLIFPGGKTGEVLHTQMDEKPWFVLTVDGVFWLEINA
jgi:hypothetical protein